jgi:hypothetical protein
MLSYGDNSCEDYYSFNFTHSQSCFQKENNNSHNLSYKNFKFKTFTLFLIKPWRVPLFNNDPTKQTGFSSAAIRQCCVHLGLDILMLKSLFVMHMVNANTQWRKQRTKPHKQLIRREILFIQTKKQ